MFTLEGIGELLESGAAAASDVIKARGEADAARPEIAPEREDEVSLLVQNQTVIAGVVVVAVVIGLFMLLKGK